MGGNKRVRKAEKKTTIKGRKGGIGEVDEKGELRKKGVYILIPCLMPLCLIEQLHFAPGFVIGITGNS